MKQKGVALVLVLGTLLVVSGCNKKTTDQASLSSTGFESIGTQAELAQLPQATTTANQQGAIEVLPIETSPVTQGVLSTPLTTSAVSPVTASTTPSSSTSHNKDIQTALKNAGFYNGSIDGKIGPASRKAISAFQSSNGLKADGKVGPKTWKVLEPFLNSSSLAAASSASAGMITPEAN